LGSLTLDLDLPKSAPPNDGSFIGGEGGDGLHDLEGLLDGLGETDGETEGLWETLGDMEGEALLDGLEDDLEGLIEADVEELIDLETDLERDEEADAEMLLEKAADEEADGEADMIVLIEVFEVIDAMGFFMLVSLLEPILKSVLWFCSDINFLNSGTCQFTPVSRVLAALEYHPESEVNFP
jgi:hypothetical protein